MERTTTQRRRAAQHGKDHGPTVGGTTTKGDRVPAVRDGGARKGETQRTNTVAKNSFIMLCKTSTTTQYQGVERRPCAEEGATLTNGERGASRQAQANHTRHAACSPYNSVFASLAIDAPKFPGMACRIISLCITSAT